ncbi:hypothetical protein MWU78_16510 [Arenibacter sp. F26102]|uniref:hypothetical protein n=1 Tax=Arenibacter sp. F26102 TaxID=2926416 RepID=UPI001FF68BE2|nr:hypothetical protein [Arenibacter sp. F26102]MCK0147263.1 hypothetical protein [Arenibacter sp. F26102]
MTIEELFEEKSIKARAKAKEICQWLVNGDLPLDELLSFAENQSPVNKATCIEAVECATKKTTEIADEPLLEYMTHTLTNDEPRVKWESAKVIGNIAKKFPNSLSEPTKKLLDNATNKGTVVRWAIAYALAEILKLKTEINKDLIPKIEKLIKQETDKGVNNKYLDALKKVKK